MTIAAGQKITAAFLSRLDTPPTAVLRQAVAQSLSNSTWVAVTLDAEDVDSNNGHSTVSNTSRYVCQVAGWYTVCGIVAFAANSSGFRAARLQVNGTVVTGSISYGPHNSSAEAVIITPTRDIQLAVTDYLEVAGWQNSGGSLNSAVAGPNPGLWLRYSHA